MRRGGRHFDSLSDKPLSAEQNHKTPETPEAHSASDSSRIGDHNFDAKQSKDDREHSVHKVSNVCGRIKNVLQGHRFKQFWKDPKNLFEILALVVLGLYTNYTRLTLNEIKSSSTDTHDLAVAANKQADASMISAEAARSGAATAGSAFTKSIESFRIDERAWIVFEPIKADLMHPADNFIGAAGFRYRIYPKNVGKTIAYDISVKASDTMSGCGSDEYEVGINSWQDRFLLNKFRESGTNKPVMAPTNMVPKALAPGAVAVAPFNLGGTEPHNGGCHYLIGRVDYTDAFSVNHWMKFCFLVSNGRGELVNCKYGNDEDHNPETPPGSKP